MRKYQVVQDILEAWTFLHDVVGHPKGGYVAVGYSCYLYDPDPEKNRTKFLMIRFDEDGKVESDIVSTSIEVNHLNDIQLMP